ncbi:MAG: PatB family C-S lyase, partial [Bacteroidales bacterium]|nr:PatB family C-S lyase [Bacteroidales bacterium]
MWNFDELIDRSNTNSVKYDLRNLKFGNKDVIPMWVADMDFKTPPFIVDAVKKRAEHEIYGYTLRGAGFYKSVMHWMNYKHAWEIQKNWITFSPGVVSALSAAVLAFTSPGDKVIVQPPVYFPFYSSIENFGRRVINNQLIEKNGKYYIDFDNLEQQIDSRTKMLMFCSPHNPVGRVWTKEELKRLSDICVKHDLIVVSDEIHSDLVFEPNKHIPLATISDEIADRTISTFAPSKTFNVAGLSSSAIIITNEKLKKRFDAFMQDLHISGGNIFGAVALEAAYTHGAEWLADLMKYLSRNIKMVKEFTKKPNIKIKMKEPESTYLLWLDFRDYNLPENEINKIIIEKAGLGFNPGSIFGPGGKGFQ